MLEKPQPQTKSTAAIVRGKEVRQMKIHPTIIVVAGVLFFFSLISGFSLSRNLRHNDPRASGKPLAGALSAVHKLVALATVIAVAMTIRNLHRGMEFTGIELTAVIFTGLFFLLMFVTGSLLSLGKAASQEVQVLHEVMAVLTFISTSGIIYILTRGRS
jgi:hypothetical protein